MYLKYKDYLKRKLIIFIFENNNYFRNNLTAGSVYYEAKYYKIFLGYIHFSDINTTILDKGF
jgi:hypothetical protein